MRPARRLRSVITAIVLLGSAGVTRGVEGPDGAPAPLPPVPGKTLPEPKGPTTPEPGLKNGEASTTPSDPAPAKVLEVLFSYGSEKKDWIEAVTPEFNRQAHLTADGRKIVIVAKPAGSGEIIEGLLKKEDGFRAHVVSPASKAFIVLGNSDSNELNQQDLVEETSELVRSPIVVAMWREQAEQLGWPEKAIGWRTLFDLARNPEEWAKATKSPGAVFRLGHTNPEQSNSGLHALFAVAYAAAGKFESGLARGDVMGKPAFDTYLHEVEQAVPFYDASTRYVIERMLAGSPKDMTAAIVYENLVINANRETAKAGQPPRVVAIYPSEGTFPSEHPIGVVHRPWVTEAHKQAALAYIEFLREAPQQAQARKSGFRPSVGLEIEGDPWVPAYGVTAALPKELKTPPASVIRALLSAWPTQKNSDAGKAKTE